ncbi:MAG: sigma-70 family RNA polymerase sigma factor [Deltaproteobacteria bacterium]|nr:sigma-70 family RNA polymerase sigma factor [Deltaproteobacteria bacterium]
MKDPLDLDDVDLGVSDSFNMPEASGPSEDDLASLGAMADGDTEPLEPGDEAPRATAGGTAWNAAEHETDPGNLEDLYFREMGAIPLARREGEIRFASGIDKAREVLHALLDEPPTLIPRVLGKDFAKPRGRSMEETLPERVGYTVLDDVNGVVSGTLAPRKAFQARQKGVLTRYAAQLAAALDGIERAKALLTEANLRLVIHIAKRYRRHGIPMLDLVQEGNIGLMKAVERYRVDTGFRFSTYASWWIHQYIRRSIDNQAGLVRVPLYLQEERRKIMRTTRDLGLELGRKPRTEEIAEKVSTDEKWVEERMMMRSEAISLDTPLSADGSQRLGDVLADPDAPSPFEDASLVELADRVKVALGKLTPREEKILRLRFGVGEVSSHSLQEISTRFRLTRERIRQIEAQALKTLRGVFEDSGIAGAA